MTKQPPDKVRIVIGDFGSMVEQAMKCPPS
jgi:hypothetical protein